MQKKAAPSSSETIGVTPLQNQRDGKLQADTTKDMSNGDADRGLVTNRITPLRKDGIETMDVISPLREGEI